MSNLRLGLDACGGACPLVYSGLLSLDWLGVLSLYLTSLLMRVLNPLFSVSRDYILLRSTSFSLVFYLSIVVIFFNSAYNLAISASFCLIWKACVEDGNSEFFSVILFFLAIGAFDYETGLAKSRAESIRYSNCITIS